MSNWVKCTDSKSDETVFVNLDNAMSVSRGKKGDTVIAFPGGKDDYVTVKEAPGDLFEALGEDEEDDASHEHDHEHAVSEAHLAE